MTVVDSGELDAPTLFEYKAHWHIFVPTLIIGALYLAGWLFLYMSGRSDGALARLFIVVLAVGVPFLFAHAFLRFQTIAIQIYEARLQYHTGWPRAEPVSLPFSLIENVRVTRGLSGRLFGGGTVIITLISGDEAAIADVNSPQKAVELINAHRQV